MYLFMDTETGGLTTDHSLLTASFIPVDKQFQVVPMTYFDPLTGQMTQTESGLYIGIKHDQYVVSKEALAVNKINITDHDHTAVPLAAARELVKSFISSVLQVFNRKYLVPAGHNVAFDAGFVKAYLLTSDEWEKFFCYPALDTASIARFLNAAGYIGGGYSLTSLRDKFLGSTFGDAHDAEVDNLTSIALAHKFTQLVAKPNQ